VSRPLFDLGDGVEVRYLETSDAEAVVEVVERDRERLSSWMPWAEGSTVETTRAFIESGGSGENLDALGVFVDGTCVGAIGARPAPLNGDCEIGYWIASSHEGRGLVTRAASVLIDHVFSELGLHRVTIRAAPDNARSRAIPERLGFTQEGVMREAGWTSAGYRDLVVYGLLEHEWRR
jgi:ribosomal-protein-serine acetyltransferase